MKNIQVLRAGIVEHSKVSEIMRIMQQKRINDEIIDSIILAVSYTHLTLPTILRV